MTEISSPQPVPGLLIESAHSGDKLIGHRLTLNGVHTLLLWVDQEAMPGFRVGNAFVPGLGETVTYAPAIPAPDEAHGDVLVPLTLLEDASSALGNFVSDHGWSDEDMQAMDNLDAFIAQHKAKARANVQPKGMPAGWSIARDEETGPGCIRVFSPIPGPGGMSLVPPGGSLAYRLLYALCDALLAAPSPAPAHEPVATLHDDGCFTWKKPEYRLRYDRQHAGWRMDVYAGPSPAVAPGLAPLTDERIVELYEEALSYPLTMEDLPSVRALVRKVEADLSKPPVQRSGS